MTLLPSLLHAELVRERSRDGRRRAAGARRLVRPSLPPVLPPVPGMVRSEGDDGGRRAASRRAARHALDRTV
jgi:hypothetical protein